jgi:hypothetical protein
MSSTALKRLAIVLFLLGTGLIAWGGGPEENPIAFFALPFLIAAALVHFRGRQVAARERNSSSESPLRDHRPDVLYLRSFGTDASTMRRKLMAGLSTEEEDLAEAVRPLGDLIAIGRPGEPLPLPGASRMYCSDDEWKDEVAARMREAPLVIIRAGHGDALLWECEQAFAALSPNRLVILVLNLKAADYDRFAREVRDALRISLPSLPRFSLLNAAFDFRNNPSKVRPGFIVFSGGWRAGFVPLRLKIVKFGYRDLATPFRRALERVFAANGVAMS